MTVSFSIESSSKLEEIYIGFDVTGGEIWDETEEDMQYGYSFPFEVTGSLHDREKPKRVGTLDGKKSVSLSGRVRNDLTEGYYKVPVVVLRKVSEGGFEQLGYEDLQIWISKGTGTDNEDDENHTYDFVLGEGQSTPDGVYPNVMNFSINLRNNSPATVYNVKASMILDPDSTKFPFEINDANYDRMFEKIAVDETVSLDYSFAIREDTYTGSVSYTHLKTAVFKNKPISVGVQSQSLSHVRAYSRAVFKGNIFKGDVVSCNEAGVGAEGSAFSNIFHRHSGIETAGNDSSLGIVSDNGDSRS